MLALLAALLIGLVALARYVWYGFDVGRAITGCTYSTTILPTPPALRRLQLRLAQGPALIGKGLEEQCAPLLLATRGELLIAEDGSAGQARTSEVDDRTVLHIENRILVDSVGLEAALSDGYAERFLIIADQHGSRWYVREDARAFEFTDDHGDTCVLERRHAYNGSLCSKTADIRWLPPDEAGQVIDQCRHSTPMSTADDTPVVSRVNAPLKGGMVEVVASLDTPAAVDTDSLLELSATEHIVPCAFQLVPVEELRKLAIHTNIEIAPTGSLVRLDASAESGSPKATGSAASAAELTTCMRKALGEMDYGCITSDQQRHVTVTYRIRRLSDDEANAPFDY